MNELKALFRQSRSGLLIAFFGILLYEFLEHFSWFSGHFLTIFSAVLPFFYGIGLAWLLNIPASWFERHGIKHRSISVLLVFVLLGLFITLLLELIVPQIQQSAILFSSNISSYSDNLTTLLSRYGISLTALNGWLDGWQDIPNQIMEFISTYSSSIYQTGAAIGSGLVSAVSALVFCIYILLDQKNLIDQLKKLCSALLPDNVRSNVYSIYHLTSKMLHSFIIGKLMDSLIVGILTAIVMGILRIPFAPLIALLIGVCNIIPVAGPIIGGVLGGIILLLAQPAQLLIYALLVLGVLQLDSHVIEPKILSTQVGLSSLWTLFAIVVGGELFGLAGMVLGVPLFAVFYTLASEYINHRLAKKSTD